MRERQRSSTGRRLFIAFLAFIALYAFASLFALLGLAQINAGLQRTRARVEGMRLAFDLASAVRDQYAHIAHTIIIGNATHVKLYTGARARVLELAREVRLHTERPDELAWVTEIERATNDLDRLFRDRIVPDVLEGRTEAVRADHQEVLLVVARIQESTDRLTHRFAESIVALQAFVSVVERRAFGWSLLFLLVAPILAGWVGISIARGVARPVARLQAGAERLAAGDLDTRIDIDSQDEFGALAKQFNIMTVSLKEHQQQLIRSEKLASIGRLAAGLAHEINNPLGVILGYARILKKKADPELAEDLGVIEEETLRCKEIVEGLLDLSRPLKSGAESVDLREVCDDVAARLAESGQITRVRIDVNGQGSVTGDAPKLRQVVLNLVKNAVEAAAPSGQVTVQVIETETSVDVLVSDSGKGIEAAIRERLFEPFFTTKERGTGLGLAVSQAIVRAHGGEIAVASEAAVGTRVTLRIPRAAIGDA